jgi:chemotaxis protein histidine kinase CheA
MNEPEADFFQIYLEETDEQIDALSEVLASWRRDPSSGICLRESLRLLSAMEGAAGAMEFENVRALTQHLNRQVGKARAGHEPMDPSALTRLLRGADFLRACNDRLRAGERLGGSAELLEHLKAAMGRGGE